MAKYGKAAAKSVKSAMHREKRGTLRSGKGGKGGRVTSGMQAIAIGLSEARKKGAKVPAKKKCPVAKKTPRGSPLADPSRLPPLDADARSTIQVIIETPKGCRNKYAFDPEQRVFELKKVLPAGMAFPYDFGFIPSTLAEDGDPVDVLVL